MSREMPRLPNKGREPCDLPQPDSTKSFWHSEPSPLLLGHRTTRELPSTADVVIIGSGITGTSVARHLLEDSTTTKESSSNGPGPNVLMLEAREACWGATGRNGGHCQPLLFEHPNDPSIGEFELANYHALNDIIATKNIDCEWKSQPGVRAIYGDEKLQGAIRALKTMDSTAPKLRGHMRLVTDREKLKGYRIGSADGAVVTCVAARLWPYKLVASLLTDLLTASDLHGTFNLQTLTPATRLEKNGNGSWKVETARGTVTARHVVLATNAYTSHLLPAFADLIVPCRGQMSALKPPVSLSGDKRLKTSMGFEGDGLDDYLIQRPNERGGHLMFGGGRTSAPSLGVTDDSIVDVETASYLRRQLVTIFDLPERKSRSTQKPVELEAVNMWTGIMGFSRDEVPWVGPVPEHEGVFIAAGFTGHGMPNTWLSGKAVATMVGSRLNGQGKDAVKKAVAETWLPKAYLCSPARVERCMQIMDVEVREQEEYDRVRRVDAVACA